MYSPLNQFVVAIALSAFAITGCGDSATSTSGDANESSEEHAHAAHGPHEGDLIELGSEEYHAEIVHDEKSGSIAVYILDSSAKKQVPIDAQEITVNAKHDGQPEQFALKASPDSDDPQGTSSRFVSNDEELAHHLDEEDAEARLVVKINGKSYSGTLAHDHDHAGHDH